MKKSEDTNAILARREAFVNKMLSESEAENVKGGWCLTPAICLSIESGDDLCLIPAICLTIEPK